MNNRPLIYCNKKNSEVNEEVYLEAKDTDGGWTFENASSGVLTFNPDHISSNNITIIPLIEFDPLIVKYSGLTVEHTIDDIWYLGQYQETIVESAGGHGFNDTSIRVIGGSSVIHQPHATPIENGHYVVGLEHRSTHGFNIKIGGVSYDIPTTEPSIAPIFPIFHTDGNVSFSISYDNSVIDWVLADGTHQESTSISESLPGGVSYLIPSKFTGKDLSSNDTGKVYIGDTSDIPKGLDSITFRDTAISGDIANLKHITKSITITNCDIHGDITKGFTHLDTLILNGCTNITGTLGEKTGIYSINHVELNGCIHIDGVIDCKHYGYASPSSNMKDLCRNYPDFIETNGCVSLSADLNDGDAKAIMHLEMDYCDVRGDIRKLLVTAEHLSFNGCLNVVGDIGKYNQGAIGASNISTFRELFNQFGYAGMAGPRYISLSGCSLVNGDIGDMPSLYDYINLDGTKALGVIPSDSEFTFLSMTNTGWKSRELGLTLDNLLSRVSSDELLLYSSGSVIAKDALLLDVGCSAKVILEGDYDWNIDVINKCSGECPPMGEVW